MTCTVVRAPDWYMESHGSLSRIHSFSVSHAHGKLNLITYSVNFKRLGKRSLITTVKCWAFEENFTAEFLVYQEIISLKFLVVRTEFRIRYSFVVLEWDLNWWYYSVLRTKSGRRHVLGQKSKQWYIGITCSNFYSNLKSSNASKLNALYLQLYCFLFRSDITLHWILH